MPLLQRIFYFYCQTNFPLYNFHRKKVAFINANLERTNLLGAKLDYAKPEGVKWSEMIRQEWQALHAEDITRQK